LASDGRQEYTEADDRARRIVLLGDLVSVYLGVLQGSDPTPVDEIERLKARLA
jgi:glucose/mannose-6-phosphate isomerase